MHREKLARNIFESRTHILPDHALKLIPRLLVKGGVLRRNISQRESCLRRILVLVHYCVRYNVSPVNVQCLRVAFIIIIRSLMNCTKRMICRRHRSKV